MQATSRYPRDFRREDVLRRLAEVLKRQRDADKAAADGEVASAEVSARAATNARIVFEPADPITLESRPLNEVIFHNDDGMSGCIPRFFTPFACLHPCINVRPMQQGNISSAGVSVQRTLVSSVNEAHSHPSLSRTLTHTRRADAVLQVYEFAKHGADWWAVNMFRHKTFVEARSVASPFVAFWRVYNFHAALLTVMGALVSGGLIATPL